MPKRFLRKLSYIRSLFKAKREDLSLLPEQAHRKDKQPSASQDLQMDALLHTIAASPKMSDRVMEQLTDPQPLQASGHKLNPQFPSIKEVAALCPTSQKPSFKMPLFGAAAVVCLAISLSLWFQSQGSQSPPDSHMSFVNMHGDISFFDPQGKSISINQENLKITIGSTIQTGKKGGLTILYQEASGNTQITIHPQTRVRITASQPAKTLQLESGTISANVAPQPKPFTVHTSLATTAVLGTRFTLSSTEDYTRLHVNKGRVSLTNAEGTSITVLAKQIGIAHKNDNRPSKLALYEATTTTPSQLQAAYIHKKNQEQTKITKLEDGLQIRLLQTNKTPPHLHLKITHNEPIQTVVLLTSPSGQEFIREYIYLEQPKQFSDGASPYSEVNIPLPIQPALPKGFLMLSVELKTPNILSQEAPTVQQSQITFQSI